MNTGIAYRSLVLTLLLAAAAPRTAGAQLKVLNPSKPLPPDRFPNRVHVFEDYETDIEKRWWLRGTLETMNVPPGSKRACRGAPSKDFDDRMGDREAMYTAVVFNPVPGPPMGKQPRLRFRYWLKGADTLKVQIFSLSKNYHRCLRLTGLPQGSWQEATVDMTAARRPDGSGGPLSEGERIDDIQFYVDKSAELLIDDIILYDAPVEGEKRPFPSRVIFTGWFDTGKQGKEWPGTFEIAEKKGVFWHAARGVKSGEGKEVIVRLDLRGKRPLGENIELFFRYRHTGANRMDVILVGIDFGYGWGIGMKHGEWQEETLKVKSGSFNRGNLVYEIWFELPNGGELLVDDVLLYEPGK
jgi:hypothetical protein